MSAQVYLNRRAADSALCTIMLTLALCVGCCNVKKSQEKVDELRDKALGQGHVFQEQAADKEALHGVLQGLHRALWRHANSCHLKAPEASGP